MLAGIASNTKKVRLAIAKIVSLTRIAGFYKYCKVCKGCKNCQSCKDCEVCRASRYDLIHNMQCWGLRG